MIYLIGILFLITGIYCCSIISVVIGFIKLRSKTIVSKEKEEVKKISVLIPVRNEEENIFNCLKALESQTFYQDDYEVIMINDHSTDNTLKVLNDFIENSTMDIKVYELMDKTSKKEALKLGIEKMTYSIAATTDADCIVPKYWLSIISKSFNKDVDMLLGPVAFRLSSGFFYEFQTLDMLAIQGIEFGTSYYGSSILNNAANLAYKKNVYKKLDGYDNYETPSGDDIFLLEKFKKNASKRIKGFLHPEFTVHTDMQMLLKDFWNQRLRWASKSSYYKDGMLIYFSGIIFFQNMIQLFICFMLLFAEKYLNYYLILLFCKWLIDFILLFLTASFFRRKRSLFYFIPVQLIYPVYILIIGIASKFLKFEWKDRRFNG